MLHSQIESLLGYGHITCETDKGKIATIFYAIFGIPMMLLCLANIGTSMANVFRFLYAKVCCGYCNYVKKRHIRMRAAATLSSVAAVANNPNNLLPYNALAALNANASNPAMAESIQNSSNLAQVVNEISSAANVADADKKGDDEKKQSIEKYQAEKGDSINGLKVPLAALPEKTPSIQLAPSPTIFKTPHNEAELLDLFEDSNSVDYKKITVPISITLFVLSSYILLGGFLFKTWESWSMLDGVYFCFITLS